MPHYEIIVIPVDKRLAANLDADKVDKGKTSKTFTVELSKNGKSPATHLWCCWWLDDNEVVELKKDFSGNVDNEGSKNKDRMFDLRTISIDQILNKLNLKTIGVGFKDIKRKNS